MHFLAAIQHFKLYSFYLYSFHKPLWKTSHPRSIVYEPIKTGNRAYQVPFDSSVHRSLHGNLVIQNENGVYVAMKITQYIEDEKDPLFLVILPYFISLSHTEKGLNMVKKLVVSLKCKKAQFFLLQKILEDPIDYISDPYCNYSYQLIIQNWEFSVTEPLFKAVCGNVICLSNQKYSSNVIEVLFENAPCSIMSEYISELCASPSSTVINRPYI